LHAGSRQEKRPAAPACAFFPTSLNSRGQPFGGGVRWLLRLPRNCFSPRCLFREMPGGSEWWPWVEVGPAGGGGNTRVAPMRPLDFLSRVAALIKSLQGLNKICLEWATMPPSQTLAPALPNRSNRNCRTRSVQAEGLARTRLVSTHDLTACGKLRATPECTAECAAV
jgi:hypothetical protein